MKFDCGETWREKRARLDKWHRWYAWYPVRVGEHDCRWLEWVEQRAEPGYECGWCWEYRLPLSSSAGDA